ncbi:MAG: DUF4236 domain-containing protein [Pyrinomonadaceae bacterium]|nr:DUF4236 domain-containing protein [Pyrinomonadaceae bacterium]
MGLSFRKSLRFGPFRVNLSKRGVGVSTGVKGLRVGTGPRGSYVSAGSHGIYYRKAIEQLHSGTAAKTAAVSATNPVEAWSRRTRFFPGVVTIAIILLVALTLASATQSTIGVMAIVLFFGCVVAFAVDRRRACNSPAVITGVWFRLAGNSNEEFLIAPAENPAAIQKTD